MSYAKLQSKIARIILRIIDQAINISFTPQPKPTADSELHLYDLQMVVRWSGGYFAGFTGLI